MSGAMTSDRNADDLEIVLKEAHGNSYLFSSTPGSYPYLPALTLSGKSYIISGLAMALYEREHSGRGQILNFSVTDSISYIRKVADRSKLKIPDAFHR